jgi:hypothetical protein
MLHADSAKTEWTAGEGKQAKSDVSAHSHSHTHSHFFLFLGKKGGRRRHRRKNCEKSKRLYQHTQRRVQLASHEAGGTSSQLNSSRWQAPGTPASPVYVPLGSRFL